ncbi:inactive tyrosine-protein kinase transmembrane receptor ROR1-like [Tubulanus polymorphus]|uniref:inactive tyrosine-protein kinase transmembrane receptor ROR1-like n=1 Tax=Tubulanus polymorphus TaxID=672921 RepID=UPI003DA1F995
MAFLPTNEPCVRVHCDMEYDDEYEYDEVASDNPAYQFDSGGDAKSNPSIYSSQGENPGSSQGYVRVDFPMRNVTRFSEESVRLRCEITGDPTPSYEWLKNDIKVVIEKGRISTKQTNWGSRLKISSLGPFDSGQYTCVASNAYGTARTTGVLYVHPGTNPARTTETPFVDPFPDGIPGGFGYEGDKKGKGKGGGNVGKDDNKRESFCQPYLGAVCSKLMANKSIYVTSLVDQHHMEQKLTAALTVIATSNKLSARCAEYAIPQLCSYAFPRCDTSGKKPKPLKICRDECELLENNICVQEYRVARSHPLIGSKFELPNCKELPLPGTKQAEKCIRIGIPKLDIYNPKHICYNKSGHDYRGLVNRTKSGYVCKNWSALKRHSRYFTAAKNPELGNHNFCRNPNNQEDRPWCFTTDRTVTREVCDIPKCSKYDYMTDKMSEVLMILIPSIAIPIVLALLLTIICMCRRSRQYNNNKKKNNSVKRPAGQQNMELSPLTGKTAQVRAAREFPLASVRFTQELGDGTFGKVYKGDLIGVYSENSITPVIIKTVKDNASSKLQADFRLETEQFAEMRHPNVVCLLGVCTKEQPYSLFYEHITHGDLHEFLLMHSPHSDVNFGSAEQGPRVLQHNDMLHISVQVAAGMEYLASRSYVHKDLAARNILVGDNLMIKISDFGLTKDLYASDYYRVQSKSLLPVRWMPPEAILYGKLSTDSDVWSMGVVLWEIFSHGLQPYYGYSNQEVIDMVRARQILPCPDDCPARMYALMIECWHEMPSRRPSFTEIHVRLRQWQGESMAMTNVKPSQSAHSGSTHHSGHSHPSQHSSTGPSNNTAMTGLTGSSGNPPAYNQLPPNKQMPVTLPPVNMQRPPLYPYLSNQNPQNGQNYQPKKPSPPGSIASHKSSPAHSSTSSSIGYKSGGDYKPSNQTTPTKLGNQQKPLNSPTGGPNNTAMYIPDPHTTQI